MPPTFRLSSILLLGHSGQAADHRFHPIQATRQVGDLCVLLRAQGCDIGVLLITQSAQCLDGEGFEAAEGECLVAVSADGHPVGEDLFDFLGDHADARAV